MCAEANPRRPSSSSTPAAERRLNATLRHLRPESHNASRQLTAATRKIPSKYASLSANADRGVTLNDREIKLNGWGYKDSYFQLDAEGQVVMAGNRYSHSGIPMPSFRPWMESELGIDVNTRAPTRPLAPPPPPRNVNDSFVRSIQDIPHTFDDNERLTHGHGHTAQEIYDLRYGSFKRVPDIVVFPLDHQQVEVIVKSATENNVAVIPYGGGTSVTYALLCPENEDRMICSLDMRRMNHIKWVDRESMLACIEAGSVGIELEKKLNTYGVTLGHQPDSFEFSSMGGWVATRASGMKKNVYGNMEDILVRVKMVTPIGTVEKSVTVERISAGPDIHHFILGSEGTLGVVTEVICRVQPVPAVQRYGAIAFPSFEHGVRFMHEVARRKCAPASIRLVDNLQFQFGHAMTPGVKTAWSSFVSAAKKFYITKYHGFETNEMTAVTLLYEGHADDVDRNQTLVNEIGKRHGGVIADEESGKRGYMLTFMIAYIRDFAFDFSWISESFETSVPWSNVMQLCQKTKARIRQEHKARKLPGIPFVSCRLTQTYPSCAVIYFYLGVSFNGVKDPKAAFSALEHAARDEVLAQGGSISHHHGIGKHRKEWMESTVSPVGMEMLKAVKKQVDPQNIFANNNLYDV